MNKYEILFKATNNENMKIKKRTKPKRKVSDETKKKISDALKKHHNKVRYNKTIKHGVNCFLKSNLNKNNTPSRTTFDGTTLIIEYNDIDILEYSFINKLSKLFKTSKIRVKATTRTSVWSAGNTYTFLILDIDKSLMELFASLEEL